MRQRRSLSILPLYARPTRNGCPVRARALPPVRDCAAFDVAYGAEAIRGRNSAPECRAHKDPIPSAAARRSKKDFLRESTMNRYSCPTGDGPADAATQHSETTGRRRQPVTKLAGE